MRIWAILLPYGSNVSGLSWGWGEGRGFREGERPARYGLLHYVGQVGAGGGGCDDCGVFRLCG